MCLNWSSPSSHFLRCLQGVSVLDALLESLEDRIEPQEDLNHTWFRRDFCTEERASGLDREDPSTEYVLKDFVPRR